MQSKTVDALTVADAQRRERRLLALRAADTDSVKELAKQTYALIAQQRAELAPIEDDHALARQVLHERLLADDRTAINDPDFTIAVVPGPSRAAERNDDAILHDLLNVRIDGEPIPFAEIEPAAWLEPPPPQPEPVAKTHLTRLRSLVKKYGAPVQAILDAHVPDPVKTVRFVFEPKEHYARPADRKPALSHTP
jgi:hypothetical protein